MTNPHVDELSMMTYISQFPEAQLKPGAPIKVRTDASKVKVTGPGVQKEGLLSEAPAVFYVDTTEAGAGTLATSVRGPDLKEVEVLVEDKKDGTFECSYVPNRPGNYDVAVKWGKKAAVGSPFRVKVAPCSNPNACKAYGPGVDGGKLKEEIPADVWVETANAGRGELAIAVRGPKGPLSSEEIAVEPMEKDKYHVNYTPPVPGQYTVDVTFAGLHINSSPFRVRVEANKPVASKCWAEGPGIEGKDLAVGEETWFKVHTKDAGKGDLSLDIRGPHGNVPSQVTEEEPDVHMCHYTPTESGESVITVKYGGTQIPGSRFRVNVEPPTDASKVTASGPGLEPHGVRVNEPTKFQVKTKDAGHGDVVVGITGPSGPIPSDVTSAQYTHNYSYTAPEPGQYQVDITFAGEPISGSPFPVAITDSSKVKVTGPGLNGELLPVNKPLKYHVDAQGAGPGEVACHVQSPAKTDDTDSAESTGPKVTDNGDGTFDIDYTPTDAGVQKMNVTFGEAPVPGTPIRLHVFDPSKVVASGPGLEPGNTTGKPTHFLVDMRQAGEGELQVRSGGPVETPIIVKDQANDIVRCEYTPMAAGDYQIELLFGGENIPNSPFVVKVLPTTDPSAVKAYGPGLEDGLTTDMLTEFFVDFKDAGEGEPQVKVEGPGGGVKLTEEPVEEGLVKYQYHVPDEAGVYVIDIGFADEAIPDSPYSVPVQWKPDPSRVKAEGPGLEGGIAADWTEFKIDLRQAGDGALDLAIEGPCEAENTMNDHGDNTITVNFNPEKPGKYNINIRFNDEHIPGSPFMPVFEPSTDASKCTADGPGLRKDGVKVGDPGDFIIDTTEAGAGAVDVTVSGPLSADGSVKSEVQAAKPRITNNDDGTYAVVYNPRKVGTYDVNVSFADQQIPDAPFQVNVTDPTKVQLQGPGCEEGKDESFPIEKELCWQADCSQAGPGVLKATMVKADGTVDEVKVEQTGDDTYSLCYTPEKPGLYKLMPALSGNTIKDTPTILVADSSKVKVYGPAFDGVPVGEKAVFTVDAEEAGEGKIGLSVKAPGPCQISCDETVGHTCTFSFVPTVPGEYEIGVTYGEQELPGNPFIAPVHDKSLVEVSGSGITGKGARVGEPAIITVDTTKSGPAPMEAAVTNPEGDTETVPLKQSEQDPDVYQGSYLPQEPGYYGVEVNFAGEPVANSPFQVPVAKPEAVQLKGDGLEYAICNADNVIECLTQDAGPGEITCEIINPLNNEPVECYVLPIDENHAEIHYKVDTPIDYQANVCYNGFPVGDPVTIPGIDPSKVKVNGPGVSSEICANLPTFFDVDATEAGKADLSISVTSPSGSEVPVEVKQTGDNIFHAEYMPQCAGDHVVNVHYGGKDVNESPFFVSVGDPGKVKCHGPGLSKATANEPAEFTVDTTEAGEGQLGIDIKGPDDCNIDVVDNSDGTYTVSYVAPRPGLYDIHVKFSDVEVSESPFTSECTRPPPDASKCIITGLENPGGFTVDCKDAGGTGLLEVGVCGSYVPAEFVSVRHNGDYTFSISYDISEAGKTTISVMWHDQHLTGSPFTVITE